jgi:16S rRNA (uracil1498-N3)-methyltransferase
MLLVRLFYEIYASFESGSFFMQRLAIDPQQLQPPTLQLTADQQHYLQRVLRLKTGAEFLALPGDGKAWRCALDGDRARVLDEMEVTTELPIAVTLALALPKTGFDDVVRQVTELGVQRILPLLTERTLLKPSENKRDRWQKIAAEATEQSERAMVPQVLEPIAFQSFLNAESASDSARVTAFVNDCLKFKKSRIVDNLCGSGGRMERSGGGDGDRVRVSNGVFRIQNFARSDGSDGGDGDRWWGLRGAIPLNPPCKGGL